MNIRLQNLSYSYNKTSKALVDVTASIGPGMHLLLGENGAGKTTMLHVVDGLLSASPGQCTINGTDTSLRLPSILSHVAFLPDHVEFPATTINDTAKCHACFYPEFDPALLSSLLARFGFTGDERLQKLSYGNRRKAQLAYMISLRPDILLLDEPANGLDIESRQLLQRVLAETMSPDQTVIVSTHTFADLERLYDGLIMLSHGRLVLAASVDRIISRLKFGTSHQPPAGCLYFEPRLGRAHYISAADGSEPEADLDYLLLYNALKSNASARIVSLINNQCDDYRL